VSENESLEFDLDCQGRTWPLVIMAEVPHFRLPVTPCKSAVQCWGNC